MECQSYYSNVSFSLSCYISLSCHSFVVEKVFNELEGFCLPVELLVVLPVRRKGMHVRVKSNKFVRLGDLREYNKQIVCIFVMQFMRSNKREKFNSIYQIGTNTLFDRKN